MKNLRSIRAGTLFFVFATGPLIGAAQVPAKPPARKPSPKPPATTPEKADRAADRNNSPEFPNKDRLKTRWPASGETIQLPAAMKATESEARQLFERAKELIGQNKAEQALPLLQAAGKLQPKRYEIQAVLGVALAILRRPDEAATAFQSALKLDPSDAGVHFNLCGVMMMAGKRAEGIEECKEAVRLDPDKSIFRTDLARFYILDDRTNEALRLLEAIRVPPQDDLVYMGTLGDAYYMAAEYQRASEWYEKIAQKWPNVSTTYLRLSDVYDFLYRPGDAIAAARKFAELEPKLALSALNLGQKLNGAGFFDESIDALKTAIAIDPDCGDAYLGLSDNYEILGDQENRLASLRNAYKLLPHTVPLALQLGTALSNEGNAAEAIEPLELANKLSPDLPDAMRPLALAYLNVYRFDEGSALMERANQIAPLPSNMKMYLIAPARERQQAIEHFEELQEAVKKDPANAKLRMDLANIFLYKGMPKEQGEQIVEAARISATYQGYNKLCIFYFDHQEYEKALAANAQALELNSHHILYLTRSNILVKLGRLDEAIEAARKATEIRSDSLESRLQLGELLAKKGDRIGALREYQTAFAIAPADQRPNFKLAWLYIRIGNKDGALRHYGILKGIAPNYLAYLERCLRGHFGTLP